jgi:hypothetical protein
MCECNRELFKQLVKALILANIFDVFATQYLLSTGAFYESNSWLRSLYNDLGFLNSIAVVKFGWSIVLAMLYSTCIKPGTVVMITLTAATAMYSCLMIWHIYLFSFTTRFV